MDDSLKEVLDDFVAESQEHLENIESELLAIETTDTNVDRAKVDDVFRAIHSIKGSASFLGLSRIGELSHVMENVLDRVRKQELVPDHGVVNALLEGADTLKGMVDDVATSNEVDIQHHVQVLATFASEEASSAAEPAPAAANIQPDPAPADVAQAEAAIAAGQAALGAVDAVQPAASPTPDAPAPASAPSKRVENIRVPVSLLDQLMNLAGELVLSRNQLLQSITSDDPAAVGNAGTRVDQVTSELQSAVMQTRMQPIGNVFSKFPRVVRDLAAKLGKEVDLTIEGKEVDLDKSLVEAIGDPLTHLVRNAIDHGVEEPAARRQAGKPEKGRVELSAFHQGGKVNICIRDDGRGLDPEKLKRHAMSKGVLDAEEAREMTDRDAYSLIFRPGFSTAAQVTDVSGRGVGMDVVRTNLESLGGNIEIESKVGFGTAITVQIPLTLAIMASVIVSVDGQRYAIPQASVRELVRVRGDERGTRLCHVHGRHMLRLRGQLLPIVHLADIVASADHGDDSRLGSGREDETPDADSALSVIVVESASHRYGICVESGLDAEEIVVKPLGRHFKASQEYSAATILGDGSVAMILDITGIAARLELRGCEEAREAEAPESAAMGRGKNPVLLFQNGNDRFAIPLGLVSRIERVRAEQIRTTGTRRLYDCEGKALPLAFLDEVVRTEAMPDLARYPVLISRSGGRELGIPASSLEDIRDLESSLDHHTLIEDGVLGSFQVDGEATRLLDMAHLFEASFPEGVGEPAERGRRPAAPQGERSGPVRILFAEDSAFFRNQVCKHLEDSGYQVEAAEDGVEALKTLESAQQPFDMVLTDLEMPNMGGLELTRQIKADPRHAHLPVVALTSLCSEQDRQLGEQAGLDEYQVKLDKAGLLQCIERMVPKS